MEAERGMPKKTALSRLKKVKAELYALGADIEAIGGGDDFVMEMLDEACHQIEGALAGVRDWEDA